jgi:hypothetical protein
VATRLFMSCAAEDKNHRDSLVAQLRFREKPIELVDVSAYRPWDARWKARFRRMIRGCDGFIALLSIETWSDRDARWEIKCADEEAVPILGVRIPASKKCAIPPELTGHQVIEWVPNAISSFLDHL